MKLLPAVCLTLIACLAASTGAAYAQSPGYDLPIIPPRGIAPHSVHDSAGFDNVDVATGKLYFQIPVVSLPPSPSGSSFDLSLNYDSHLYNMVPVKYGQNALRQTLVPRAPAAGGYPGGWRYNVQGTGPRVDQRQAVPGINISCTKPHPDTGLPEDNPEGRRRYIAWFVTPDGTPHVLHRRINPPGGGPEIIDDEGTNVVTGDGFSDFSIRGRNSCLNVTTPNTEWQVYYTADGSYLRFEIKGTGETNPTFLINPSQEWRLFYPDGRRIEGIGPSPAAFYDANGNKVSVFNQVEGSTTYTYLQDDFGRYIRLHLSIGGGDDTITTSWEPGAQWIVNWGVLVLDTAVPREYYCGANAPLCTLGPANGSGLGLGVVHQVRYPAVNNTVRQWTFYYTNDIENGTGFGEVDTIVTPEGATYNYTWAVDALNTAEILLSNHVVSRTRTYDSKSEAWGFAYAGSIQTTVTAPDSGQTIYQYFYYRDLADWRRGQTYLIAGPNNASISKRYWDRNLTYGLQGPNNVSQNNPYISRSSLTMDASGSRTAVSEFMIDKNGNLRSRKEHDWVNYASGMETVTDATLLRKSEFTYHLDVPLASAAMSGSTAYADAYWGDHCTLGCSSARLRLDAASEVVLKNHGGNVKEKKAFVYDDPYTTGNLTKRSSWDSEKQPEIPSSFNNENAEIYESSHGALGRPRLMLEPDGALSELCYHATDCGVASTRYPIMRQVDPAGEGQVRTLSMEWDFDRGTVTSEEDDNGIEVSYEYDLYGRLKTATQGSHRETRFQYVDAGDIHVLEERDLNGFRDRALKRKTHFDALGRVVLVEIVDGYSGGQPTWVQIKTNYDITVGVGPRVVKSNAHRSVSDPTLEWTCVQMDMLGRVKVSSTFKGGTAPTDCDAVPNRLGRATTSYNADETTATDAAGKARIAYRDALGRIVQVIEDPGSGNLAYTTSYEYDTSDNLTKVIQGDQVREFTYSTVGRLLSAKNPESGTTTYTYTSAGRLDSRKDANNVTIVYCYDGLGRLEKKFHSASDCSESNPAVTYTYGVTSPKKGLLTSVHSTADGVETSITYNYDEFGRVQSNSQSIVGGDTYTYNYTYRLNDAIETMTYPSGKQIAYHVDSVGRVDKVSSFLETYMDATVASNPFLPDGRIRQMRLGNGLWETRDYAVPGTSTMSTVLSLGTDLSNLDNQVRLQFDYSNTHDNGNVLSQATTRGNRSWTQQFVYDGVNRLGCAIETSSAPADCDAAGNWKQRFGYDQYGNRWVSESQYLPTSQDTHTPVTATNFIDEDNVNRNRLNKAGALYDYAGNQKVFAPYTLTYDAENRLKLAESSGSGSVSFLYDGLGRRVRKVFTPHTGPVKTTVYTYDLDGQVAAEYSSDMSVPNRRTYIFSDILGSVRAITNDPDTGSASVIECYDYLPFGQTLSEGDGDTNRRDLDCHDPAKSAASQRFTGQERDAEIGLDNFMARQLSAAQGRFASADLPFADQHVGDPQSWNLYSYARNNPLKYTDPSGTKISVSDLRAADRDSLLGRINRTYGCSGCAGVDADGFLTVDTANVREAVRNAAQYLTDAINSEIFFAKVEVTNNSVDVSFGQTVFMGTVIQRPNNRVRASLIRLDFGDDAAVFGDEDARGAFLDTVFAHEVAHVFFDGRPQLRQDPASGAGTGPVVDTVNRITDALGRARRESYLSTASGPVFVELDFSRMVPDVSGPPQLHRTPPPMKREDVSIKWQRRSVGGIGVN